MTPFRLAFSLMLASVAFADMSWQLPRLPDGTPDLQGVWTNRTITTLERPDGVDDLVLNPEEAREVEQRRAEFYDSYDEPDVQGDGTLAAGSDPGGYNTFWMDEGTQLAVIDGQIRSSLIVDPADGQIPYRFWARLKMFGRFRDFLSYDNPETRPLGERCVVGFGSTGGPPMLPVLYNNHYQIVQSPGYVMILVEMNHDARIIRIGGEHPPASVRPWLGDSIGRWDGDTLVVETTNFHPDQGFRAATKHVLYSSSGLTVTERFARVAGDRIRYAFTMDDSEVYTRAWSGEIPFRAAPGPIYEYACHEGNYALPGILAGARAEEAAGTAQSWWQTMLSFALD